MRDKPVNPVYSDHDLQVRQFLQSVASAFGAELIYRDDKEEQKPTEESLSNLTLDQLRLEAESIPIINPDLPNIAYDLASEIADEDEVSIPSISGRALDKMGWKHSATGEWYHPLLERRNSLVEEINRRQESSEVERLADEVISRISNAKTEPRTEEETTDQPTLF